MERYRVRLAGRGIVRFEVQAPKTDRELIRSLARSLSDGGPEAGRLRRTVQRAVAGERHKTGGILAALRRSPLVGINHEFTRPFEEGRKVDL